MLTVPIGFSKDIEHFKYLSVIDSKYFVADMTCYDHIYYLETAEHCALARTQCCLCNLYHRVCSVCSHVVILLIMNKCCIASQDAILSMELISYGMLACSNTYDHE